MEGNPLPACLETTRITEVSYIENQFDQDTTERRYAVLENDIGAVEPARRYVILSFSINICQKATAVEN